MPYLIVGLSHKTAPLALRERLAIPASKIGSVLHQLTSNGSIQEAMLLSTCNRVEVCLVAQPIEHGIEKARGLLASLGGVSEGELNPHLYIREEEEAIAHLFRVSASLDSMVVGETQISHQVKEAYRQAVLHQTVGTYLNKLLNHALRVSKKIRTETAISEHPVSVSSMAVALAAKIFGDLKKKRTLLVGAGETGELTGRHLVEREVGEILVTNRSRERAEKLSEALSGRTISWEDRLSILSQVDIVISSVQADRFVFEKSEIEQVMLKRKGRSMFFIDLGVPRNIDSMVNEIENVYLYNIDDLQGIVAANQKEREKEAKKAEEIVWEEVLSFQDHLQGIRSAGTIKQMSEKIEKIRESELQQFYLKNKGLDQRAKEGFEACAQGITNKILHEIILRIKGS